MIRRGALEACTGHSRAGFEGTLRRKAGDVEVGEPAEGCLPPCLGSVNHQLWDLQRSDGHHRCISLGDSVARTSLINILDQAILTG